MWWKAKLRSFCCSHGVFRIIFVFGLQMFTTNIRKHVSAVNVCHDLKPDLKSLNFSCSELRANVAALERSLADEKERCSAERQRRKELHNALVVRTDSSPRTRPYIRQKLPSSLLRLLQELRGNIRVHCRVRPVLPFDHIQSSFLGSGWVQNHH